MNFIRDLARLAAAQLDLRGVGYRRSLVDEQPVFFLADYLEFCARRIPPRPRRVLVSDVLSGSKKWSMYRLALESLSGASERGEDLSRFQTGKIESFKTPDLLLSDWGIHHLHLGKPRLKKASVRTSDLLFVRLTTSSELCFIDIGNHQSFGEVELLDIVERNWPETLSAHFVRQASNLQPKRNAHDREVARRAGMLTFVELSSGRVYAPPGGGITSARSSVASLRQAQSIGADLVNAEVFVEQDANSVRTALGMNSSEEVCLLAYDHAFVVVGPQDGRAMLEIPFRREAPHKAVAELTARRSTDIKFETGDT
jgi:hypothetical protein